MAKPITTNVPIANLYPSDSKRYDVTVTDKFGNTLDIGVTGMTTLLQVVNNETVAGKTVTITAK